MADILAGLFSGMKAGKKANADRAKAEAEARQKEANWQLKLAKESRLLQTAAEDEWQQMEAATMSDDWDPAMLPSLLDRAMRFDNTYGKVWRGKSAFKYFGEAMHAAPQKVSGSLPSGAKGTPSPDTMQASPLAGFRSEAQRDAVEANRQKERTRQVASDLQNEALSYLRKTAVSGGMLDPIRAPLALLQWQAEIMDAGDYDPTVVMDVMDNLRGQLADVFKTIKDNSTQRDGLEQELRIASEAASRWVNQQFAVETGLDGAVTKFMEGTQKIRNEMDNYVQGLLLANYDLATAKIMTARKYIDPDTGEWSTGAQADPLAKAYSQAPPWFELKVEQAFAPNEAGVSAANAATDVPIYVPETGEAGIINKYTGQWVGLFQQARPVATEPTVVLPPDKRKPVETQQTASEPEKPPRAMTPEEIRAQQEYEQYIAGPARAMGGAVKKGLKKLDNNPFAPRGQQ